LGSAGGGVGGAGLEVAHPLKRNAKNIKNNDIIELGPLGFIKDMRPPSRRIAEKFCSKNPAALLTGRALAFRAQTALATALQRFSIVL
jgi:hypothetical protein